MTPYLIGTLVGRLLMSALLVYLIVLIINRFQFKQALAKLKDPLPLMGIVLLFLLGLSVNVHAEDRAQVNQAHITLMVATGKGQLTHIEPMAKVLWKKMSELPQGKMPGSQPLPGSGISGERKY